MKIADLDIVYFVKDDLRNEELRYSLRSVDKNMPHKRLWIFGGCPLNIVPDVRVRVDQKGKTKWDRGRNMFRMACENKELTENFILFNDDFFVMQPTDHIDPMHRGTLQEYIEVIERNFMNRPTNYTKILRECDEELVKLGATRYAYELHMPFIFNKKGVLQIIKDYPYQHCTRTFYGNLYNIGGEKHSDVKVFNDKPTFDYKETQFLSTDDPVVNINNGVWRYIRKQFEKKSKWEL